MKKHIEAKLYGRDHIKGIKTWAAPLRDTRDDFMKWTKEELPQMDQRTRKLMMMHQMIFWQTICVKKLRWETARQL